jgi:hypothetical protein
LERVVPKLPARLAERRSPLDLPSRLVRLAQLETHLAHRLEILLARPLAAAFPVALATSRRVAEQVPLDLSAHPAFAAALKPARWVAARVASGRTQRERRH